MGTDECLRSGRRIVRELVGWVSIRAGIAVGAGDMIDPEIIHHVNHFAVDLRPIKLLDRRCDVPLNLAERIKDFFRRDGSQFHLSDEARDGVIIHTDALCAKLRRFD